MDLGLGYFGHMPIGETDCDPRRYLEVVPIAPLADNADIVLAGLNDVLPVDDPATGPGVRGACDYLQGWYEEGGQGRIALLVITGSLPGAPASDDCSPTLEDAAQAASECLEGQPSIETYVLAVSDDLAGLNQVAAAGGTQVAHLVDSSETDAIDTVVRALRSIRD